MAIMGLAIRSFRNRKFTTGLTVLSIALSVMLLLSIEKIHQSAETSFISTISGTDLIIGARTSPVQLLLYSVFSIGNPTNNLSEHSYRMVQDHPQVMWTIPLSFGDSHRGFRVVGTTDEFHRHYRFAQNRQLKLMQGQWFAKVDEAVIGAEVAAALSYRTDDIIVVAHGSGEESFINHTDKPFRVAGIIQRTGTPVDRSVYVSLDSIDGLHEDMYSDHHSHDPLMAHQQYEDTYAKDSGPARISAILIGLRSRSAALALQRTFNEHKQEPITAIMPGVELLQVWQILGAVEKFLTIISALVVVISLFSMFIILVTSMNERRREMAILRSVGARPIHVFALIMGEAVIVTLVGISLGIFMVYSMLYVLHPWLESALGMYIAIGMPSIEEIILVLVVAVCGMLVGLIPSVQIYRYSLADGLMVKI